MLNQKLALDKRGDPRCSRCRHRREVRHWVMIQPSNAQSFDEELGFKAMKLFLEAYWERGGKASDDLAVLLGSLEIDPAQRSDWADALHRARGS